MTSPDRTAPQPTQPAQRPTRAAPRPRPQTVRRRTTVRKVDPWSVLKLSLIFYFCLLLVVMLGLAVFWAVVNRLGVIETMLTFLGQLQFDVTIDGGNLARAVFLTGLVNVVLWSGINVFAVMLYNLVADVIGGLKVTLLDEE
jgi:hypothetical protein